MITKNYAEVANNYDDLYGFTHTYTAEFAAKHLKLKPNDLLADVGEGTGAIAALIGKKACLNNAILCVDPSVDMLRVAETRPGIKTCLATADTFFDDKPQSESKGACNKLLLVACAHLFPKPLEAFRKAFEYLPPNGLLVMVQRSTECTFPVWKSLKDRSIALSVDGYKDHLERAGFHVTLTVETGISKMMKRDWYDKLRNRIFTVLSELSDEEIEEGIREVDQEWFRDKKDNDVIEIRDNLVYFTASKLQQHNNINYY